MRVLLIENPMDFDEHVEPDMSRWWHGAWRWRRQGDEVWIELADRSWCHLRESVKRLASFGVTARVANRQVVEIAL